MSFFSSLGDIFNKVTGGGGIGGFLGGVLGQSGKPGNLAGNIAGSVVGGILTRKKAKAAAQQVNSSNPTIDIDGNLSSNTSTTPPEPDMGVRMQVSADANNPIPVVYGEAWLGGKLTETVMTNNNTIMWYVLTLCERTGNKISGEPSEITFKDVYWNNQRVVFDSDGVTIAYTVDANSKQDGSVAGLVEIYCYNNGSANQTSVEDFPVGAPSPANSTIPTWSSTDSMEELVFMVVKVKYSPTKNVTGLPPVTAHLNNSMTLPGDCLFDYMTNTRYGAGIPVEEINVT